jgi:hypothetical protein
MIFTSSRKKRSLAISLLSSSSVKKRDRITGAEESFEVIA